MSGFDVNADELDTYAGKLGGQRQTANQISGLVDKADVSNESWGVVGIFVFDNYKEMLGDLKDLFTSLDEGFASGEDKFKNAAKGYRDKEQAVKELLDTFDIDMGGK
ncbi:MULTISPECIES: ESX-1 secretion-associated protein [Prauserella salsuginis group]|uniref:Arginine decarboxylase-like protein n=2 Tax=Prauserella salsuginis group TaxID=2893672 RepID=A0A839XN74_9PSEU|nr:MULTISPECIES: ESX-1 secretion-associated protein [Prauserella salsuginis group]MBB3662163.1 arginine decarboxylase-like protein [Prauserella sediminis]MCR3719854.1 hypothetical protein [Prauserella flava]MCR3736603.1 hypothetical protein [Prauserella salsuginis]